MNATDLKIIVKYDFTTLFSALKAGRQIWNELRLKAAVFLGILRHLPRTVRHRRDIAGLLRASAPKVFYLSPSSNVPTGGIRTYYVHAETLTLHGIPAFVVHASRYFRCTWFESRAMVVSYAQMVKYGDKSKDAVVIPDIWVKDAKDFKEFSNRFVFCQNYGALDYAGAIAARRGIKFMTCGRYLSDKLRSEFGIESSRIYMPLDDFFVPAESRREPKRIMFLMRKEVEHARRVAQMLSSRFPDFDVVGVGRVPTRRELAAEYQKSNIFLAFGYPEGFPFPPLEAMACGCLVVGYSGGGGSEFMIDGETAYVAQDANVGELFEKLVDAIEGLSGRSEAIRLRGTATARKYTAELFTETLLKNPWFSGNGVHG